MGKLFNRIMVAAVLTVAMSGVAVAAGFTDTPHDFREDTPNTGSAAGVDIQQWNLTGDASLAFLMLGGSEWLVGIDSSEGETFNISNATGTGQYGNRGVAIRTNGNVGIGTTNPEGPLHVLRTAPNTDGRVKFGGTGDINAAGLELKNIDTSKLWDITVRANSNDDLWFSGYNGLDWTTPLILEQTTGDVKVAGAVTSAGKNLVNAVIQRPSHIIYKDDTDGSYKAVRLSDGVVTHSHATDAAAVINGLLSSLGSALYYSPSNPNPDFREGRKIVLGHGVFNVYQTIVIPPNQDFIFEADRAVINAVNLDSDIIRIDSSMNSKFILPIINSHDIGTCVRIKPQTQGPDDLTWFTTSELYIEAVGGQYGLILDASVGTIDFLRGEIKELNSAHAQSIGIYIPVPGIGNVVRGNELKVLRVNVASQVANVVNNSSVKKNLFWINNADNEGVPINIPTTYNNKVKKDFPTGW